MIAGHERRRHLGAMIAAGLSAMAAPALAQTAAAPPADPPPAPASDCPPAQHWDAGMSMCMAGEAKAAEGFGLHINQFAVYSVTSGHRGASRATGPGMWMLTYDHDLTPANHMSVDVMASPEQATVGDRGTPQLLQTENIDNMHAHDTLMAVEIRDGVELGGDRSLTFLFAPRGEAAVGPVPFMHRASAEANPDAPLGHSLQDGFHDASTVFGLAYQFGATRIEATGFSGHDLTWPLPLHRPDSYAVRVNRRLGDHVGVGASFADALLPTDAGGAEHTRFTSAWLTTDHSLAGGMLKSAFIWGQAHADHGQALNSLLAEGFYQRGANRIFARGESLEVEPDQLGLILAAGPSARWVRALTVGYERRLLTRDGLQLFAGGSYTQDFVPGDFRPDYGADPRGGKVFLRMQYAIGAGGG